MEKQTDIGYIQRKKGTKGSRETFPVPGHGQAETNISNQGLINTTQNGKIAFQFDRNGFNEDQSLGTAAQNPDKFLAPSGGCNFRQRLSSVLLSPGQSCRGTLPLRGSLTEVN